MRGTVRGQRILLVGDTDGVLRSKKGPEASPNVGMQQQMRSEVFPEPLLTIEGVF